MRPPEFTGGNLNKMRPIYRLREASMRPPEFTGGNIVAAREAVTNRDRASMRPPEFTGGNSRSCGRVSRKGGSRFNEAAGIHRRKLKRPRNVHFINNIASMRPPEFTGGNDGAPAVAAGAGNRFNEAAGIHRRKPARCGCRSTRSFRFNEAAGIHRRKHVARLEVPQRDRACFNEAAGIHRRKRVRIRKGEYGILAVLQ